jgi:hypothetical protein
MVIDTSTANGVATSSGMKKASSGTATSASPKPNAERISVAANRMIRTSSVVDPIAVSFSFSLEFGFQSIFSWRIAAI